MGLFGLALLLLWLTVVGVARSVLVARRGGPVPLRLRDPVGSPQWCSRVAGTLAFALAVAAPIADASGLPSFDAFDGGVAVPLGVVLVALGAALSVAGQSAMGASWRGDVDPDARTALITAGPFRRTRNPILAGVLVSGIGLACVTPNVLSILMLVCFVVSVQVQVRLVEEPYLDRVHGEAYREYASRVGRFVPGVGRLRR